MKKTFFIAIFLIWNYYSKGQIIVQDNLSIVSLVQQLKGTGVEISKITYDCDVNTLRPYGYYQDTTGYTGLSEGLLLTTGGARLAVGPNNNGGQGIQNVFTEKYDPDLLSLVDTNISNGVFYDICKVEFDISIYSDELSFKYVFGSEEYPEFVGSFHDVFGFFISGPGIVGTKNMALIPGTNDPVSVSTVNPNVNSFYYKPNGDGNTPPFSPLMQYDGFTKVLTSKTKVIPCETYHIKLIIADEGDGIYDSGIFFEAGSFKSSEERISQRYEYPQYDYAIEGCNKGYFILSRIGAEKNNLSQPVNLEYSITGSATNGTDYDVISGNITIPAFQNNVELEINAILDAVNDDNETLTIAITNGCPALPATFSSTMIIKEYFNFSMPPIDFCANEMVQLNKPPITLNYAILWEESLDLDCYTCHSPVVQPDTNVDYGYTLTDTISGCTFKGFANISILPQPDAFFTYSFSDIYTNLDVFFYNQTKLGDRFYWEFGDGDTSNVPHPMHTFKNTEDNYNELEFEVTLWATNTESGCKDNYSEFIKISDPFLVPNIITPNEDMENDAFYIAGIQPDVWTLRVFNRWGKLVFKTETYNNRWTAEGIPDGVYYYDLLNQNKEKQFEGWLQIVR